MNHCTIQRNGVVRSGDDLRCSSAASASAMFMPDHLQRRESVVCPKPRRMGLFHGNAHDYARPTPRPLSHGADISDSEARSELLDIILTKGGPGHNNTQVGSSSPPFFCGSPPSRVSNPLIQDARFQEEKLFPPSIIASLSSSPAPPPCGASGSPMSPTSAAARKGGCMRASFGRNPAVRVEGFDCLDRDRSTKCRIPALA